MFHREETRTIGQLARDAGCKVETIRYYEKAGLMPEPGRTVGGHRVYRPRHVERLRSIRRCRELGFSTEAIRVLLGLADTGEFSCDEVMELGRSHLELVRLELRSLRKMESALEALVAGCSGGATPSCRLLDDLFATSDGEPCRQTSTRLPPGSDSPAT